MKDFSSLTPKKIEKLINVDQVVRGAVNDQDIRTIRLIVILQSVMTIIVLIACASLIGVGVWLSRQPEPLSIVPRRPVSASATEANQPLVDLDPLKIEWETAGRIENVSIFLENVDSKKTTGRKTVAADVRDVTFSSEEVLEVASTRGYRKKNRIRGGISWSGQTEYTEIVDIYVGIEYQLFINERLISPSEERIINTLVATIDDSTENMPHDYCFSVDFVGWNRTGPLVALLKSCNKTLEVDLPFLDQVDWSRHTELVLNQPVQDRHIAKTCISAPSRLEGSCP